MPKLKYRMWQWAVISLVITVIIAIIAPSQLGILLLKASYITIAVCLGYYADRILFPKSRIHECEFRQWHNVDGERTDKTVEFTIIYGVAQIRRALIVFACVLGFAIGL